MVLEYFQILTSLTEVNIEKVHEICMNKVDRN